MSVDTRLRVLLLWHMHQPDYRDPLNGEYRLPWTYLHGIKDYVDMAAHLEAVPEAHVVVNFAPVLLEQLDDYATWVRESLQSGAPIRDPVLSALASPPPDGDHDGRLQLLSACLRANDQRLIERHPAFTRLAGVARRVLREPGEVAGLDDQFFTDLVVWYHLAWMGETVRRDDSRIGPLLAKQTGFTVAERRTLLAVIGDLLDGVIGRYRRLADRGQIELSVSPLTHPMLPLLQDLGSAREAMPDVPLPSSKLYPGGEERARWQMEEGLAVFERHFGRPPRGCWPSEGGISQATLRLLAASGIEWAASGGSVLHNSLQRAGDARLPPSAPYSPCRFASQGPACFFRDDHLSDLIGFEFSTWHADDAVANLIAALERIRSGLGNPGDHAVGIMLDGENAWEHYPENAYHFLRALHSRLADHPSLRLSTPSECLDAGVPIVEIPSLVAGSWVHGSFATWLGHPHKNRAWDLLCEAKQVFDGIMHGEHLAPSQRAAATRQLAVCEGSDWFWWLGDDNAPDATRAFDELFRRHLARLYRLLAQEVPETLSVPLSTGGIGPEHGGAMRRGVPHRAGG